LSKKLIPASKARRMIARVRAKSVCRPSVIQAP
jgi:hypothetical protein